MDTVATRIHESGLQLARQRDAFLTRTLSAGEAFLGETRDAGRQLVSAVQTEAKRWRRFATQRTAQLRGEAEAVLSLPAVERTVLSQVDGTLRAIDARVRARLAQLEDRPRKSHKAESRAQSKAQSRKPSNRARKSKQTLPAIAA
jgi:uncharacterized membrane protein